MRSGPEQLFSFQKMTVILAFSLFLQAHIQLPEERKHQNEEGSGNDSHQTETPPVYWMSSLPGPTLGMSCEDSEEAL